MKKNELQARVRYNKGNGAEPNTGKAFDPESLVLETSQDGGETWGVDRIASFWRCDKFPEDGRNFIHYDFIYEMLRLLELGYNVCEGEPIE